jgi:hypothetical protein
MVVVVSEETAMVSVANRGRLYRDLAPQDLRDLLAGPGPVRVPAGAAGVPA